MKDTESLGRIEISDTVVMGGGVGDSGEIADTDTFEGITEGGVIVTANATS